MPELGGGRLDPVRDPGPPVAGERHSGVAYDVLLDVRVPRLGRDWGDVRGEAEACVRDLHRAVQRAQRQLALEEAETRSRSSNKMPGKRKRKKRRKKKVPKASSSTSSRRVVGGRGRQGRA